MLLLKVIVQMPLSSKSPITIGVRAVIRSLSCMQPHVGLEISFLVESFPTILEWTHEVAQTFMLLQMDFQPPLPTIGRVAARKRASKHFEFLVRLHVVLQVAFRHKRFLATFIGARKRPNGGMDFGVSEQGS